MKWFKHDTDANMDAKLQEIMLDYGLEGYGLYWYCIELVAQNVNGDNLTFELEHDARIIARNTGSTPQKVTQMMTSFINLGLLDADNGHIFCLKLAARCDDFTAKAVRRKGIKPVVNQSVGVSLTNSEKVPLEVEVEVRSKKKEKEVKQVSRFDEFYDLYDKKTGGKKVKVKFDSLSKKAIDKIFEVVEDYVLSTPNKQYRKAPLVWLNGEHWNDEIERPLALDNYDYVIELFNDSMACHGEVPQAVMMDKQRIENIEFLFSNTDLNSDSLENYFNHCSTSESFAWFRERNQFDLTWYLSTDAYKRAKERK